jgi:hypothetical protein
MVNFNANFSSNSKKTAYLKSFKNCVIPLILFSCFFLGIFWIYSLTLLISDFPLFKEGNSQLTAGGSLLSYTSTIYEYVDKIPGLVYGTDKRFMDQTFAIENGNDDVLYDKYSPKLFEFKSILEKWDVHDTSPQVFILIDLFLFCTYAFLAGPYFTYGR